ncbi:MAG: mannose-1-phosphate guanylyltransferase [Spirochaetia bacterium]|nr:mannose-1-phosphate guanylyltransferase [Spirochaetia bacterium]
MIDDILILAGGSGTRLWPASLSKFPKQYIKVKGDDSLLALTIKRALALNPKGKIYIISLKSQMETLIKECAPFADTGKIAIIPEPAARNTAPAIGIAVKALELMGRADDSLLVLPADHMIEDIAKFTSCVEKADVLSRMGHLVTFGIKPLYPETGYGYIEQGKSKATGYIVKSFREKPDLETAKKFLAAGTYLWNSGMFCFTGKTYWKELSEHSKEMTDAIGTVKATGEYAKDGIQILMDTPEVAEAYTRAPSNSIDYAVMEKSVLSAVVSADFDWNDIGSWDQFETLLEGQEVKDVYQTGCSNTTVFSDIPVALCDVSDITVVIKNGKALICRKGSSQKVKEVRAQIEDAHRKELL